MSSIPENIDELIASYLSGEASPDQIEIVDRWRKATEENSQYFEHLSLIFETSGSFRHAISFDTDYAWAQVQQKLNAQGKVVPIRRSDSDTFWLRVAAGVIILIAAGIFTYRFVSDRRTQTREIVAVDNRHADTLSNGSIVFLNRQTKIEYLFDRRNETHIAKLSGEAYFGIEHDDGKDFIVEAGETLIKDIGTSFNVRAYPDSSTIEVVVEEGEVLFYTRSDPAIRLKAGDKGTYDRMTGEFTVGAPDANVTAYKTKIFRFSNHTLGSVVTALNEVYDTKLRIEDNLTSCKLTVTFREESIDEIVHVIAETLGLSFTAEADGIWLRGAGCGEAPSQ